MDGVIKDAKIHMDTLGQHGQLLILTRLKWLKKDKNVPPPIPY